jgi:hypothetical protein
MKKMLPTLLAMLCIATTIALAAEGEPEPTARQTSFWIPGES